MRLILWVWRYILYIYIIVDRFTVSLSQFLLGSLEIFSNAAMCRSNCIHIFITLMHIWQLHAFKCNAFIPTEAHLCINDNRFRLQADACIRQYIWSALVQAMVYRLFGAMPLSATKLAINCAHKIKCQYHRKQNTAICGQVINLRFHLQNVGYYASFSKWDTRLGMWTHPRSITTFGG